MPPAAQCLVMSAPCVVFSTWIHFSNCNFVYSSSLFFPRQIPFMWSGQTIKCGLFVDWCLLELSCTACYCTSQLDTEQSRLVITVPTHAGKLHFSWYLRGFTRVKGNRWQFPGWAAPTKFRTLPQYTLIAPHAVISQIIATLHLRLFCLNRPLIIHLYRLIPTYLWLRCQ
jgi:hypothetical protein